jgi:predicted nucleic acid-binding protein
MGYLIDSNVLIDYVAERFSPEQLAKLDNIFDADLKVSVITKIETLGFNAPGPEEKKMLEFMKLANIVGLSDDIVLQTIDLRKQNKLKTPDAIIAATALTNNLTLLTRNTKDFKNINGLSVIDPHTLA